MRRVFTNTVADAVVSKSATELTKLIQTRVISSVEVVEAFLRRIEEINPSLNAIVTVAPDVLEHARAKDAELARGKLAGPLHGLPITIKDTIDTEGIRTTYGSRVFGEHIPRADAAVVARLKAAGAIILGKTNVPEMAIPYETDNPVFGKTNNPFSDKHTPGGSSGGEASAIAARLSPAGVGSDLSGSIRVPAHFCGIAALKPTTGVVPMEGHLPRAAGALALGACIGPMARYVEDLALLFSVMAHRLEGEPSLRITEAPTRVSWYADDGVTPVAQEIVRAVQHVAGILRDAGYDVHQEVPPGFSEGQRLWIEVFSRTASEEIRDSYRGREHDAGPLVTSLLKSIPRSTIEEEVQTAEAVAKAVLERERWREDLLLWMRTNPLIISPVCATAAFEHGAARVEVNGESLGVFRSCSYSQTINVFGLPAAVVPVARTATGLPIGVQIVGRPFEEHSVLATAAIIEKSVGLVSRASRP
jgi:Asp-tRNA(Asn)/Glu-tRNA(Gln) amidotransferase A subunit family amidase